MSKFKVGDRVRRTNNKVSHRHFTYPMKVGDEAVVSKIEGGYIVLEGKGEFYTWHDDGFELVEGPVRIVTRLEIVGGDYGKVHVSTYDDTRARIGIDSIMNAKELTDAIATLAAIRDALQDQDK